MAIFNSYVKNGGFSTAKWTNLRWRLVCLGFLLRLRRGGSRNLREKHAEIEEIMWETQGLTRPGKHMVNIWIIYA